MPPSKNGPLGRGLGDLFGGIPATIGSAATLSSTGFVRLSPDLIGLPPDREARAQEVGVDLVESIRTHGILQPILVRRRTQGYEVVVGARRLVAARLAGLKEIPAVITQATDEEVVEISKAENTCREHITPPALAPVVNIEASVPVGVEKPFWTPARGGLTVVVAVLLLAVGGGIGLWIGGEMDAQERVANVPPAPAPYLAAPVEESVPVVDVTPAVPPPPVLDSSELRALESDGLALLQEGDGAMRVMFVEPLFSSRVTVAPDGAVLLKKFGAILAKHSEDWVVLVTGHTDAIPLRGSGPYRDNKELGLARAMEVIRYLMREGSVPAGMLTAATAGEESPPYPGDDADSRRKNRTVTIQIRRH